MFFSSRGVQFFLYCTQVVRVDGGRRERRALTLENRVCITAPGLNSGSDSTGKDHGLFCLSINLNFSLTLIKSFECVNRTVKDANCACAMSSRHIRLIVNVTLLSQCICCCRFEVYAFH